MLKYLHKIRDYFLIKQSGLFDEGYYCLQYPDIRSADVNPLWHFISNGWKEFRNPSAKFDVRVYLDKYLDVKRANQNPLVHYIRFGVKEGRTSLPINSENSTSTEANPQTEVENKTDKPIELQRQTLLDLVGFSLPINSENSTSTEANPQTEVENRTDKPIELQRQTLHDLVGLEILKNQQREFTPELALSDIANFQYTPLISIVMPMFNPDLKWLKEAILSLQSQYYAKWELCVTDDGSSNTNGIEFIKNIAKVDERIKLRCREENGGISAASNDSLSFAAGVYIALMDQDDAIPPDALLWVVEALQKDLTIDFIYTDECKVDTREDPIYSDFFFKPDWSPEMMINFMYTGHLSVYKKNLIEKIGGFRSKFDYAQDYDLALRASEKAVKIHHIERVMYFWRKLPGSGSVGGKDYSVIPTMLALKAHYKRQGMNVLVTNKVFGRAVQLINRPAPKISIIIPTDNETNILNFISMLVTKTSYSNLEIVVVTNTELCKKIKDRFPYYASDFLQVSCYDKKPFNFSDKCNQGSSLASGDIFVFLNDDAVPNHSDWLEPMLDLLLLPGVGGVSPLMVYEDSRVQYAGIQAGQHTCGLFGPSFHLMNINDHENMIVNPMLIRDVSVLTGACLMIKKSVFNEVGGFDSENTPNGHSDVDLSLRVWEAGYRCVFTPFSVLTHPGNGTWSLLGLRDKANIYALTRWKQYLVRDRYFTKSMRQYNLHTTTLPYELHLPENWNPPTNYKGAILLISHELSRTGAPVVAATAARILKEQGYFVVVASFREEPIMFDILNDGIPVIIDQSFQNYRWRLPEDVPQTISHSIRGIIHEFDLILANTFVCHNIINCYNQTTVPILWWLHEGNTSLENGNSRFLPKKLGDNVRVLCGGEYVQKVLKDFGIDYKTDILLYGVEDIYSPSREKLQEKVRFIYPGSFEKRKNHKLLFDAINMLSPESRERSEYICIGTYWDQGFYDQLKQQAENIKNLTLSEPIPYEQLMDLYNTCDCVVVPSIDDPMPVVLAEGMMLSKILLCSDMTGTSYYIEDGVNGFVFDCNDAKELAARLEYIINHRDQLGCMKSEARKLYEEYFSTAAFQEKLLAEVGNFISLRPGDSYNFLPNCD